MWFGTHTRPGAQLQGFWVKPPQGPSSPETQAFTVLLLVRSALVDSVGSGLALQAAIVSPVNNPNTSLAIGFISFLQTGENSLFRGQRLL
jgi:hypothetical protein